MATTNECLIRAAGNGSRIASLSGSSPKPLVPLFGVPLLEHIIVSARAAGIDKFVIVLGYRAEAIRNWFADHPFADISITLVENPTITRRTASQRWRPRTSCAILILLGESRISDVR